MVAFVDEVFGSERFGIEINKADVEFIFKAEIAIVAVAFGSRAVGGGFGDDDFILDERFKEFEDAFETVDVGGGELVVDVYEIGFDDDGSFFGESFADLGFDEFQGVIDVFCAGIAVGECDAGGGSLGSCRVHEERSSSDAVEGVLQK